MILSRFSWNHVRSALAKIDKCKSYYVGGSLCIDMAQGYSVVLNQNGRGFIFMLGGDNMNFLMPKDV
jgi:thiamine biosynthesis protein ThiC